MKRWYVVQVYAGSEQAVQADIQKTIQERGTQDLFGEVLIPSAKLKQMFNTQESKDEQLFPGYIIVEMSPEQEAFRLVQSIYRVVRFLGGKNPVPLSKKEVDRIISQMEGELLVSPKTSDFVVNSEVEIKEGPFAGFVGIIERVDEESEKLTVMVSIFGRMTPVELGFNQVTQ